MPKRDDIHTILVIGSGPIVIGQGCEFDYSGAQACKSLRDEGYRVVLVNSNPATIMTDPAFSDRTYIEPITPETVEKILAKEKDLGTPIDVILPTLGGQTALNCACALYDSGVLDRFDVELIGANRQVIHRAEDRQAFSDVCRGIGLATPESRTVSALAQAEEFVQKIGLPAIIRPAFTLGGWGGGIAYNNDELQELVTRGLRASMIGQVQIDRSLIGWKEYELEVVRDKADNCVIVCGIENIDAMGVHTGDSITVAPILTLTDKEYQVLRDASLKIMRAVGVETGGSNVQFAVNPNPQPGPDGKKHFEFVVVEMNPRVSRSSALASKATGFPIAKIAAKLAVGYTLDELRNDITGSTSACFEPSIDYVVTKMPRWTFEKFPEADETLTTQMKSVGEAMAIGRTLKESLQKVIRSMEVKRFGLGLDRNDKWLAAVRAVEHKQLKLDTEGGAAPSTGLRTADGAPIEWPIELDKLTRKLTVPSQGRIYYIRYALKMGWSIERISQMTQIDPFFIDQIGQLVKFEDTLCRYEKLADVPREVLFEAKRLGYSDAQLANLYLGTISTETILEVRRHRQKLGIECVYKLVDTCAAEFEAVTPYYYSTYQPGFARVGPDGKTQVVSSECELRERLAGSAAGGSPLRGGSSDSQPPARRTEPPVAATKEQVVILGGGPNRIGQGIEFDYCCVHAALAARELGFESVMINSNPETVSTDYDTSDLLFFEPLTLEDVLNVVERLNGGISRDEETKRRTDAVSDSASSTSPPDLSVSSSRVRGLIVQFGGQTPLNLAHGLASAGVPLLGTPLDSIDLAEDRDRFDHLLDKLNLQKPASGIARSFDQAVEIARRIGFPVLVRPSYVLGGRGMEICPDEKALRHYMATAVDVSGLDDAPILIDKFLDGATEVDVDVVADFQSESTSRDREGAVSSGVSREAASSRPSQALICGVMEHIEHAGVHSGDSTCTIPPYSLRKGLVEQIKKIARGLATELKVCGLMNVQLAVKDDDVYIIEVNPRASRTVPFVGKAKGVPWASIAAKAMMGVSLAEQGVHEVPETGAFAVKGPVFPFQKFPGVDFVLGPEMRSTGEVMGLDVSLPVALLKTLLASGVMLPREGGVFISVRKEDKPAIIDVTRSLMAMGFTAYTTPGTAELIARHGLRTHVLQKIGAGARPNVIDLMQDGRIALVINTPTRTGWQTDEGRIRALAVRLGIPMLTTATAAKAAVRAIEAQRAGVWDVAALQDYAGMVEHATT
ncbi:MAG: carbamoyl-phosphate synthase large subunit [Leptolyngbya sp. PLA3]|nr:MAG: carbamoyl-phosphate synthase large subunit [Cyanobacteria bacterium CYA]MCE7969550.1 carbamoyl-phosphate synthase large subunit [Leptolyngbya sp. PL-A3]